MFNCNVLNVVFGNIMLHILIAFIEFYRSLWLRFSVLIFTLIGFDA